jgi:predicted DNA-binding transcriptional regulator AlpA
MTAPKEGRSLMLYQIDDLTLYSREQTAGLLGVSSRTLDRLVQSGRGPRIIRISAGRVAFLGRDVKTFLENQAA